MNLIQDDQAILVGRKIQLGIRQLGSIRGKFQVEVERREPTFAGETQSQLRLAHLSGGKQRDASVSPLR